MIVITDKQNNVVGINAGDSEAGLSQMYPNNPDIHLQYNEYQMLDDKNVLNNPYRYCVVNDACVLKQPTIEEKITLIRQKRDYLLKESDYTQLSDVPIADRKTWANYRQQLRDFPTVCDPDNPVWPVKP